ncbi:MAG: hypothetical protein ACQCXQ_11730, partial [Verrucomicrobiales bacterium]
AGRQRQACGDKCGDSLMGFHACSDLLMTDFVRSTSRITPEDGSGIGNNGSFTHPAAAVNPGFLPQP